MEESQIGSLRTLISVIEKIHGSPSDVIFYRGHYNKNYKLEPSIYRRDDWITNEHKMIQELLIRCPGDFNGKSSSFEKLVKMQHYDLPTRLLDITENPLVALYFACYGDAAENCDGELIFFKIPKDEIKYFDSDTVSVCANISWLKAGYAIDEYYSDSVERFKGTDASDKLIHCIRQEKPYFKSCINPEHMKSVLCVKPKLDNQRIIRQDGAFLLFGMADNKNKMACLNESWVLNPEGKRFVIKQKDKKDILKQLSYVGISKAKLFPEIDMVSQFIKAELGLPVDNTKPKKLFDITDLL